MNTFAARLHAAVAAVCPVHGVTIGRRDDRSSWIAHFTDEATEDQRHAAQAVIDATDYPTQTARQELGLE
jgi:hypothetical protein